MEKPDIISASRGILIIICSTRQGAQRTSVKLSGTPDRYFHYIDVIVVTQLVLFV